MSLGLRPALIAALVIGFLNATLGCRAQGDHFSAGDVTFGIFLLVINAAMILLASDLVGGFECTGWTPAFWGAVVLSLISLIIRAPGEGIVSARPYELHAWDRSRPQLATVPDLFACRHSSR